MISFWCFHILAAMEYCINSSEIKHFLSGANFMCIRSISGGVNSKQAGVPRIQNAWTANSLFAFRNKLEGQAEIIDLVLKEIQSLQNTLMTAKLLFQAKLGSKNVYENKLGFPFYKTK